MVQSSLFCTANRLSLLSVMQNGRSLELSVGREPVGAMDISGTICMNMLQEHGELVFFIVPSVGLCYWNLVLGGSASVLCY